MSNGWAKLSTAIAWLALIGGIIGGIILAVNLDWYFALIGVLSGLVSFCLFGTLGFIADKVGTTSDSETPKVKEGDTFYDISINGKNRSSESTTCSDLCVYLDDQLLRTIKSDGPSFSISAVVSNGSHKLIIAREDDKRINAIKNFEIQESSRIDFGYILKKDIIEIASFDVR